MPVILCKVADWLHLRRTFLTLLVLAIGGGYLWVRFHEVEAERDRFSAWVGVACAAADARWLTPEVKGSKPGQLCAARIAALDREELDTASGSARALAQAMADHVSRTTSDSAAARDAASAAAAAAKRMEAANAHVTGTHVDGAWFGAVNDAAGLHAD
ncbi:MAG: hypothetical protein JO290_04220 [Sphingomonadaceae bacterium]|nr:hypothetical protein [Sphingomonadaceae bacterium]